MFPVRSDGFPRGEYRPRKYPLTSMKLDEWFFVPRKTTGQVASHISAVGKKIGRKFSVRAHVEDGVEGVVIIRME